jgi:uncharacterized membrane protein
MNCRKKLITTFVAIVLGITLLSFDAPGGFLNFSPSYVAMDPLARLFQILFILFIISPPLIVILLYKIWQELKERNKMK